MGKFEGNSDEALAERLYGQTLDGTGRELGDVDGFGWYALVRDEDTPRHHWYIINEDSQGFVTIVEGPMTFKLADAEWKDLEAEWTRWNQEGD